MQDEHKPKNKLDKCSNTKSIPFHQAIKKTFCWSKIIRFVVTLVVSRLWSFLDHRPRPLSLGLVPDEQRIACNPCLHPRTSSSESAVAKRLPANKLGVCVPRPLQTSPIEFIFAGGRDKFIIVVWV